MGRQQAQRILLTGATGFVGRQILRVLAGQGHVIRAVVRSGSVHDANMHGADIVETPDLFAEPADWWRQACRDIDVVVHAAWYVVPGRYLEAPDNLACVRGSLALAEGAIAAGVGHVIGLGTCAEYRLPSEGLTFDSPLEPTTLYGVAKKALYELLSTRFDRSATSFAWARLFYLFGEGEAEGRLFPHLQACLAAGRPVDLSTGTQLRDFLDVADAARMIAILAATRQLGAINVCSGRGETVRQFAERVADTFGRRDLLRFGAVPPRPTDPVAVVGICNLEASRTQRTPDS